MSQICTISYQPTVSYSKEKNSTEPLVVPLPKFLSIQALHPLWQLLGLLICHSLPTPWPPCPLPRSLDLCPVLAALPTCHGPRHRQWTAGICLTKTPCELFSHNCSCFSLTPQQGPAHPFTYRLLCAPDRKLGTQFPHKKHSQTLFLLPAGSHPWFPDRGLFLLHFLFLLFIFYLFILYLYYLLILYLSVLLTPLKNKTLWNRGLVTF